MIHRSTPRRVSPLAAAALAAFAVADGHALITYEWVPDAGSGGAGTIVFDDDYLAANDDGANILYTDPGNFITPFASPAVVEINFTFDNGFSIDQAAGFSTTSTIQSELATAQFQASNDVLQGIIGGWSFEYTNTIAAVAQTSYDGADIDEILCVVLPCPQGGAHFNFTGPAAGESNQGVFRLVPEPTSAVLLGLGTLGLARRRSVLPTR